MVQQGTVTLATRVARQSAESGMNRRKAHAGTQKAAEKGQSENLCSLGATDTAWHTGAKDKKKSQIILSGTGCSRQTMCCATGQFQKEPQVVFQHDLSPREHQRVTSLPNLVWPRCHGEDQTGQVHQKNKPLELNPPYLLCATKRLHNITLFFFELISTLLT